MNPNGQPEFNVDFSQTEEYICPECEHQHFTQVYTMRKLSAMLAPTGNESYIPVPVYACANCHHVPEPFLPPENK
jgi:hypothetical protein